MTYLCLLLTLLSLQRAQGVGTKGSVSFWVILTKVT